jgi:uncharacterized protein YjbJ (UPF0337 family)
LGGSSDEQIVISVAAVVGNVTFARPLPGYQRRVQMDKDRVEGAAKQVKGNIKEGVGKLTGDAKTEAEGKADKAEGKVQNTVGGIKDKARELLDDK